MTVNEWSEEYRMLPSNSAEPGHWRTDRVPYMSEVMESFTNPAVNRIVVKSASQVGKSEVLLNIVGRMAHLEPCNMLIIQPTVELAEDFSKSRLSPMIADTKILTPLFYKKLKSRDSNQTILSKFYRGGRIVLIGANSPAGLASRPIKIILCDEVDRYPADTGEGDPIDLATKRTTTYFDRKIALFSTPTYLGASRIDMEYEAGTQEEWKHACPKCGEYSTLSYKDMEVEKDAGGNVSGVQWRCPACGARSEEQEMKNSAQKYVAKNPGALANKIRSFWVNSFSSPWLTWREIMQEWSEVQGNATREAVVMNTRFGTSYELLAAQIDEEEWERQLEEYGAMLPDGVLMLTCGVDVQANRLHYIVYGWSGKEAWGIEYNVVYGAPTDESTWHALFQQLDKVYTFADGFELKIARTFIDSGFATERVYSMCRKRLNTYPIKGLGTAGIPLLHRYTALQSDTLIVLGVNDGKAQVYGMLERTHYGRDNVDLARHFDKRFFRELMSEQQVLKYGGLRYETKKRGIRNEGLDVSVYALAAMRSLVGADEIGYWEKLRRIRHGKSEAKREVIKRRKIDIWS